MKRRATRLRFALLIGMAGFCGWLQPILLPSALGDDWRATAAELRQVQEQLRELGFEPGPADGVMGRRTKTALQAYQRSIELPADGKLTFELYQQLTAQPDIAAPAAEQGLTGSAADSTCAPGIEGSWQFEDELGSRFALTLREGGSVADTSYPRHWRWQVASNDIEITYDNGMGTTVTRVGRLTDGVLLGNAKDSRGRAWVWRAVRSPLQPETGTGACQTP